MPDEGSKLGLSEGWHLDRRIPIALILTLIVYAVTFIWLFSQLQANVTENSKDIVNIQSTQKELQIQSSLQNTQLGRIEEQIIGLRRDLSTFLRSERNGN